MVVPVIGQTLLDRYRVVGKLGEGGFGSVYEAEHLELGSRIAIKALEAGPRPAADSVQRFLREAQVLTRLSHPCAVKVFDRGLTEDGRVWMAMELLEGETLDVRLRRGPMLPGEVVDLFRPLCELLAEAHGKGIVHRDLKPQNIMLVPVAGGGVLPKLFDFGIAGLRGDDTVTDPDAVSGTPRYMAPEQWEGLGRADARSDVYSLGVILYESLSGVLPLEAEGTLAWLAKHRYQEPRDLRDAMAGRSLPAGMRRAVMRALAKNPDERQVGALELADELAAGLDAAVAGAEEDDTGTRRRGWLPGAGAATVLLAAGAAALFWPRGGAVPAAAPPAAECAPLSGSYMPLSLGSWWRYRVLDPGTLRPEPVEKTIRLDRRGDAGGMLRGDDAVRLFRNDADGTADRWLTRRGDAVVWLHDEWRDTAGGTTRAIYYQPHRLRVDDGCPHRTPGARWTQAYVKVERTPDRAVSSSYRVEDWLVEAVDEEVTVPAGTFRCLRLRRRNVCAGEFTDSTYWFAPGVGKVKESSPPEELEELVGFHIEGG